MGQKLCCMRPSIAEQQPQRRRKNLREDKMMTLEQCLKNSPAINPRAAAQPKKRVYPSSPSSSSPDLGNNTPFYTPRLSFSSTSVKMEKIDEVAQPCMNSVVVGRREKKVIKKVSFRLPEKDDIIVFYSPKPTFDCIAES